MTGHRTVHDYSVSDNTARTIAESFANMRDSEMEGNVGASELNMRLELRHVRISDEWLMSMCATWSDRWGMFRMMEIKGVEDVQIADGALVVRAMGLDISFGIRG